MIKIAWSNNLDALAVELTRHLAGEAATQPADVLSRRHCIVVPNRILQHWLQHRELFHPSGQTMKVLANIDFPLVHIFVNDWLFQMTAPGQDRDPEEHPFAVNSLLWRIYAVLADPAFLGRDVCAPLQQYIDAVHGDTTDPSRRRFVLATQLSRLFDRYQVYRPDMLWEWEQGRRNSTRDDAEPWQAALWAELTTGGLRDRTYLANFRQMSRDLAGCGIQDRFKSIHVFGVSMMPRVYMLFFDRLSDFIETRFYLFNPCRDLWDDVPTPQEAEYEKNRLRHEGIPEDVALLGFTNPILGSMGRGCRDFLAEILDLCEGERENLFVPPDAPGRLGQMQQGVLNNTSEPATRTEDDDRSLQVHICHSPMREVEVLHDHLLRWFAEDTALQPREIQVLVPDMAIYAPYIDAVFGTIAKEAPDTIPYVIADRVSAGESAVVEAFKQLLQIFDSRFTAPEVMDLPHCESVRAAFDIEEDDMDTLQFLVRESGVRWGRDAGQWNDELELQLPGQTSWQHGLDRLLLGYALTAQAHPPASHHLPLPCDRVEGDSARTLGKLARFVDCLCAAADYARTDHSAAEWADHLDAQIRTFFAPTDATHRNIEALRRAVQTLRKSAGAADLERHLPAAVVRDFMVTQLGTPSAGEDLVRNAVVFSALRTGAGAPRRMICLLGLEDRQFPRNDNRPAYDLMKRHRRRGDQSVRIEDRMACLEVLMHAQTRLYISYVGRTIKENADIPPSTVLAELIEYAETLQEGSELQCRLHKLQPFHHAYFNRTSGLFSYDRGNARTSRALAEPTHTKQDAWPAAHPSRPALPEGYIELEDVVRFFKNPAERFYRDVLKVRLEQGPDVVLPDSEEFAPSGRVGYEVDEAVVNALLSADDPQETHWRLCEEGLAPLASWGQKWFEQRWSEIKEFLDGIEIEGHPLRDILNAQAPIDDHPYDVPLANRVTVLTGRRNAWQQEDGTALAVDFRYTRTKPRDELASWIRHLFACASGLNETRYHVARGSGDREAMHTLYPVPPEEAVRHLTHLLEEYHAGTHTLLPFTPGTGLAYVRGRHTARIEAETSPADQERAREESGLAAARREWYSAPAFSQFKEDLDPYFLQAFGPQGPFDTPGYAPLARAVFEPMVAAETEGDLHA